MSTTFKPRLGPHGEYTMEVDKYGQDIIHNPLLNKGTCFTLREQEDFGLTGLLPPHISTLGEQLTRTMESYHACSSNISKYIYLRSLQDRNETLFYAMLRQNIREMMPIVYTPTVGEAVEKHGHIYRNARGLFITPDNVFNMEEMAKHLPSKEVEVIVVTDSQAILGIGDQGVGGMAIPIGKLSLYTVAAGIHPSACLPICLDVGTDNRALLADPLYLGRRHWRLTGSEYAVFIENFVEQVKKHFPNAVLQWEDFAKQNAFTNMDKYRDTLPSFNDDVQGTGAVVLGGILGAMKIKRKTLQDHRYLIYGAGAAGGGIARQIRDGLKNASLSHEEACDHVFMVDSAGLVTAGREGLEEYKKEFAKPERITGAWKRENVYELSMAETIRNGKINVLIGVSGQTGTFNEQIVNLMMANDPEPLIFTLSNPTSKSETDPRKVLQQTNGRAIVASGSPFGSVMVNGREMEVGQGNNAFIFPGLGLGTLVAKARKITDGMLTAAAHALAACVTEERLAARIVYPPVQDIFEVSHKVAVAVYKRAVEDGVAQVAHGSDPEKVIRDLMWLPAYATYVRPAK